MLVTVGALALGALLILGVCSGVLSTFDLDEAISAITVVSLDDDRLDSPVIPVGDSPRVGPETARVTVVVFGDYQDRFTRESAGALDATMAQFPDDLRIVFKNFPLPEHERAVDAAQAAVAARGQGQFWAYHRKLLDAPALRDEDLVAIAVSLSLDVELFEATRRDHVLTIDADVELAMALGVRGTPTLFVNGQRFEGLPDDLVAVVSAEIEATGEQTYARRVEVNLGLVD